MKNHARGFTFVELIIAMAVAVALVAVAAPSFREMIISNRLSVATNDFISALSEARGEGLRRNAPTLLCGSSGNPTAGDLGTLAAACAGAGSVVARVVAADGTVSADLIRVAPPAAEGISLSNVQPLVFSGRGFGRQSGANGPYSGPLGEIYTTKLSSKNRRCVYLAAGSSISTCAITSQSGCPSSEPQDCY